MITVKFYGLLRLDTGLQELQLEAADIRQLKQALLHASARMTPQMLDGCAILVNGIPAGKRTKLNDGDRVTLLSPVAGG